MSPDYATSCCNIAFPFLPPVSILKVSKYKVIEEKLLKLLMLLLF